MSGNRLVAIATFRSLLIVSLLTLWQLSCGGSPVRPAGGGSPAANISLSPASAAVGSSDLGLIVTATQQFSFTSADHKFNQVVWTATGTDTALETTFVNSSQLTAVVPASLFASPLQAKVRVEVWDIMGDVPDATSSSVTFPGQPDIHAQFVVAQSGNKLHYVNIDAGISLSGEVERFNAPKCEERD